jgi:hypothetical protein
MSFMGGLPALVLIASSHAQFRNLPKRRQRRCVPVSWSFPPGAKACFRDFARRTRLDGIFPAVERYFWMMPPVATASHSFFGFAFAPSASPRPHPPPKFIPGFAGFETPCIERGQINRKNCLYLSELCYDFSFQ